MKTGDSSTSSLVSSVDASECVSCGTVNSNTSKVITIARTASVRYSKRFLFVSSPTLDDNDDFMLPSAY